MQMAQLLEKHGRKWSDELGIRLKSGSEQSVFGWWLAALLFGAPISSDSAAKTWRAFRAARLTSPRALKAAGWQRLVDVLDSGGYTRYDFKTADKLLEMAGNLISQYGGSLNALHSAASSPRDLEARLMGLAKGIGPTTVAIFLRDMRGIWPKADPAPTELELAGAQALGVTNIKSYWARHKLRGWDLANFETALMKIGKEKRKTRRSRAAPGWPGRPLSLRRTRM